MLVHLNLPLPLLENVKKKRQHQVKQIRSTIGLIYLSSARTGQFFLRFQAVFLSCQISLPCKFSGSVQICLEHSMYVKQSPNIFHLFAKKRPHGQKQTSVVILVLICLNKKPLFGIVSSWNTNIFNFANIIWHLIRTLKKRNIFCYMDSVTKTYFG